MITICLITDWDYLRIDILAQTPGNSGVFNECQFLVFNQHNIHELPQVADALVVLNSPFKDITIRVRKDLTFLISQEPPTGRYSWHRHSFRHFSHIYTQWPSRSPKVVPSHGFLTWYIDMDFDYLRAVDLSTHRSRSRLAYLGNKDTVTPGQRWRNDFVDKLQRHFLDHRDIRLDLIGKSYGHPVDNKYDSLSKYRYVLAVENTIANHYWTEKLSDIFLAGALPLYIGPENIFDYFPRDSIVRLRPGDMLENFKLVERTILDREFEKRIESVKEARELILTRYNLFYRMSEIIRSKMREKTRRKNLIHIPANYWRTKPHLGSRILNKLSRIY